MYRPRPRVLLVEDNADDELLARRALKKTELEIDLDVVRDGAEALDYLFLEGTFVNLSRHHVPDVIFLDLHLPRLDGLTVLQRIRSHPRTELIPVVILSSSDEVHDIDQSYALGANSYVRKPVNFDAFIEAVRQLGQYWLTINTSR